LRKTLRAFTALAFGLIAVLMFSASAFATITTPSSNPVTVQGDGTAANNPVPFDIVANGFTPGAKIGTIICDGVSHTTPGYQAVDHCDFGSSKNRVTVDANGVATFPANNINYSVNVFRDSSPSGQFNCLAPGEADPNNGQPSYTNCQVKLASADTDNTSDWQFLTLTLPSPGTVTTTTAVSPPPDTPEVPYVALLPIAAVVAGGVFFLRRRKATA
jgi:hypothetical protein